MNAVADIGKDMMNGAKSTSRHSWVGPEERNSHRLVGCIAIAALATWSPTAEASLPCSSFDACITACEGGEKTSCERIRAVLTNACDGAAADVKACAMLGELYETGEMSTEVSLETSVKYLQRACELGDGRSCNNWGFGLAYGQGVPRDDAAAIAAWKRGCELDNARSCGTYGERLRVGRGIARNDKRAGEVLAKACNLGDAMGCSHFGFWNEQRGLRKEAVAAWTSACAAKHGDSCDTLRELGMPIPAGAPTPAESHADHVKVCDGNQPIGCAMLADDYRYGRGVAPDQKKAVLLDARACDGAYALSCSQLGRFFGDQGAMELSDRFYSQACDLGNSTACGEAGFVRRTRGTGHDARTPLQMFQLGCRAKDAASCFGAGGELEGGAGARANAKAALRAYEQACGWGHAQACVAAARIGPTSKAAQWRQKACSLGVKASCAPAKPAAKRK